ncbi:MAG: patatin-like phospholipase family protein [Acidobacteriota bacterium]
MSASPLPPPVDGKALVLSGGGSLGAYQVGVLQALAQGLSRGNGHQPFDPPLIVGTSAGAFNAAFLVAQGDVPFPLAVDRLKDFWLQRIADHGQGNGVFRYRLDPTDYFRELARSPARASARLLNDLRSVAESYLKRLRWPSRRQRSPLEIVSRLLELSPLVSPEPLWHSIQSTIDFDRLRSSPRRLVVTAMTWPSFELHEFDGREPLWRREGACILLAATAIPGVFPPITVNRQCLADSSVLANTPIGPAINAQARDLHLVSPMVLPWQRFGRRDSFSSISTLYGLVTGSFAGPSFMSLRDIAFLDQHPAPNERPPRDQHQPPGRLRTAHLRDLDVKLYLPSGCPGHQIWQLLDFRHERIARLIDQGFRDATEQRRFSPSEILPSLDSGGLFVPCLGTTSPYAPWPSHPSAAPSIDGAGAA